MTVKNLMSNQIFEVCDETNKEPYIEIDYQGEGINIATGEVKFLPYETEIKLKALTTIKTDEYGQVSSYD